MTDDSRYALPARTIGWALGLSILVHSALILLIEDEPGGASSLRGSTALNARIEPLVSQAPGIPEPEALAAARFEAQPSPDAAGPPSPGSSLPEPARPAKAVSVPSKTEATRTASQDAGGSPPQSAAASGIEMPFVRDPTYYAMAALDTPPRLLGSAEGCYPQGAVGEVAYVLSIGETGSVDEAKVVAVDPAGLFTAAAAQLCARLKFSPATKDGRAVRSRVRLVVGQPPA